MKFYNIFKDFQGISKLKLNDVLVKSKKKWFILNQTKSIEILLEDNYSLSINIPLDSFRFFKVSSKEEECIIFEMLNDTELKNEKIDFYITNETLSVFNDYANSKFKSSVTFSDLQIEDRLKQNVKII